MDLQESLEKYIKYKRAVDDVKPRTVRGYHRCLEEHFFEWVKVDLVADLEKNMLWNYVVHLRNDLDWMQNTIAIYITNLRTWLRWLWEQGYHEENLAKYLKTPKRHTREEMPPTDNELEALLEACSEGREALRDRALILFLAVTGARRGEVPEMTKENVRLDEQWMRIYQPKTERWRYGFLTDVAAEALREYLDSRTDDEDCLFRSRFGGPLGYDGIYQMLRRRAIQAGIDPKHIHTHNFRRYFATRWVESGGDEHRLMRIMDWSSAEMLDYYVRLGSRSALQSAFKKFAPTIGAST